MQWEVVIGLETHVQLSTDSKIFSGASTHFGAEANTQACYIDLALPGALPVLNRGAVERGAKFGFAIGAEVAERSVFDRKNYFYPDLPKGYQISQFEHPIVKGGKVTFRVEPKSGEPYVKTINLTRAHLEEDAGKSNHGVVAYKSGMDLNRAGTPLLEIVTEPELRSSAEAVGYAKALHALVVWLGISRGNMQEGNFRCDANVSVRPLGSTEFGTRCEIKNLNSFRSVERVIEYEIKRQTRILQQGGQVVQETRGWNDATGETTDQRSKESAADYRYMPEPDLPPLRLTPELVEAERQQLPPLPTWYRERLTPVIGSNLTEILLDHQPLVAKLAELDDPQAIKLVANLFSSVLLAEENASLLNDELPSKTQLTDLVTMRAQNELSSTAAKEVFLKYFDPEMHYKDTRAIAKELGVIQENDTAALEALVDQVLAQPTTAQAQTDYRNGQTKVLGFLVGQVMKASHGQANPTAVQAILRRKLS